MKLIIDIDYKTYNMIKDAIYFISGVRGSARVMEYNALKAIYDGKPLPKGHGRLIDESKIDWLIDPDVRWTTENRIKNTSETVIEADKEEGAE